VRKRLVGIVTAIGLSAFGGVGVAQSASAFPCNYEIDGRCSQFWVPTRDTCRNIAVHGAPWQLSRCLAFVWPSRG